MLAVILSEDDAFSRSVASRLRLLNYSAARYRDAVKLVDNLPELNPDAIVIRLEDFPLHWQILASELACMGGMNNARILLCGDVPGDPGLLENFANVIPFPDVIAETASSGDPLLKKLSGALDRRRKIPAPSDIEAPVPASPGSKAARPSSRSRLISAADRSSGSSGR